MEATKNTQPALDLIEEMRKYDAPDLDQLQELMEEWLENATQVERIIAKDGTHMWLLVKFESLVQLQRIWHTGNDKKWVLDVRTSGSLEEVATYMFLQTATQ